MNKRLGHHIFQLLLDDFGALHGDRCARREAFLEEAADVLSSWRDWVSSRRDSEAESFNVFAITRRANFEVTTHSAMLGDLLNPLGAHGQGVLFLEQFLGLLSAKWRRHGNRRLPPADADWRVHVEHAIAGNQKIDILLHHRRAGVWIPIENKVGAPDQPTQLLRYWGWACRTNARQRWPIVYLTPCGDPPSSASTGDDPKLLRDLIRLSYRSDIASILLATAEEIRSDRVGHTLRQYIQTIGDL